MAPTGAGGSEGFSSDREGQRPQRLQEAAQDKNQRSSALHQDRLEKISACNGCFSEYMKDGHFDQIHWELLDYSSKITVREL